MGTGGYGVGGGAMAGTSNVFLSLPYKNYRDLDPWFEEFINALAANMEILDARFISSDARANLLDPTYTPPYPAQAALATATAAPTASTNRDNMLDLIAAIALSAYPLSQNFTTAEKQGMVATGGNLQRRKGTRQALLKTAAACAQVVAGWTVPPFNFSVILPDGLPSSGQGTSWSPVATQQTGTVATTNGSSTVTGTGTAFTSQWVGYRVAIVNGATVLTDWVSAVASATSLTTVNNLTANTGGSQIWISPGASFRPWILEALRQVLGRFFPDWSVLGIGPSQFRVGYSAVGETILPSGATLDRFTNPHFDTWTGSTPTGWSTGGSLTLFRSATVAGINYEFTASAAQIDLTAAAAGASVFVRQSSTISNQLQHRVEVDYAYTNSQLVNTLTLQIIDDTNSQYWNPATGAWQTAAYSIALPVSASATTRTRYGFAVTPQSNSSTATTLGTASITAKISALSDGTATTQGIYTLYRCSLLPMYSSSVESQAGGERTLWLPLVDQLGMALSIGATSATIIEPANASRSAYKLVTGTGSEFPYHAVLTGRGFRPRSAWTNLIKGSNDFVTDWSYAASTTGTPAAQISPVVGETVATAIQLTGSVSNRFIQEATGVTPTSKSYVGGVWVKKLSADNAFTDVTLSLISTSTISQSFTLTQAQGWQLLPIRGTFGVGDVAALTFRIGWGASSAGSIAVADAYLYDVTGKAGVLYPPVVRTVVGATASTGTRAAKAISASQDVNVLGPELRRTMVQLTRGVVQLTVVPVFDAASQPNGTIFTFGEAAGVNDAFSIAVVSGILIASMKDSLGNLSQCGLTLTAAADPLSTQVTWQRDTKIVVLVRWQDSGAFSMSAGNSSTKTDAVGGWTPVETGLAKIRIGCDLTDANQFDGIVTLLDELQIGAPAS